MKFNAIHPFCVTFRKLKLLRYQSLDLTRSLLIIKPFTILKNFLFIPISLVFCLQLCVEKQLKKTPLTARTVLCLTRQRRLACNTPGSRPEENTEQRKVGKCSRCRQQRENNKHIQQHRAGRMENMSPVGRRYVFFDKQR